MNRELFWRHRVVLKLLEMAPDREVEKLRFIKWLFLLKFEEEIGKNPRFYDFLPFKYGPFSFLAYRELEELSVLGLIEIGSKNICLNLSAAKKHIRLSPGDIDSLRRLLDRFGDLPLGKLVRYVYKQYPWYASKSKKVKMDGSKNPRPIQFESSIFTIGYEHLSIDAFLNGILEANIAVLIDSRSSAVSRKYGFSKMTLKRRTEELGIKYYDFGMLGIPFGMRNGALSKGDLWAKYRRTILSSQPDKLIELAQIAKSTNAALLCFECDPHDCHRHILAKEVEKITKLQIVNFNNQEKKWELESRF